MISHSLLMSNTPSPDLLSSVEQGDVVFAFDINIGAIISTLNYFTLAWCILYSFLLVSDFFFWRVMYSNLEIPRIKRGEKSIFDAAKMWLSYVLLAFAYMVYTILYDDRLVANVLGMFVIGGYIVKLILDLPLIPVLGAVPKAIIEGSKKTAKVLTPDFSLAKKEDKKSK